jgi:hypothetical protein
MSADLEVCDRKLEIPSKQRDTVQREAHLLTFGLVISEFVWHRRR